MKKYLNFFCIFTALIIFFTSCGGGGGGGSVSFSNVSSPDSNSNRTKTGGEAASRGGNNANSTSPFSGGGSGSSGEPEIIINPNQSTTLTNFNWQTIYFTIQIGNRTPIYKTVTAGQNVNLQLSQEDGLMIGETIEIKAKIVRPDGSILEASSGVQTLTAGDNNFVLKYQNDIVGAWGSDTGIGYNYQGDYFHTDGKIYDVIVYNAVAYCLNTPKGTYTVNGNTVTANTGASPITYTMNRHQNGVGLYDMGGVGLRKYYYTSVRFFATNTERGDAMTAAAIP